MNTPLEEGIQAAKAGDKERARTLLMAAVAADETNETAWLWLSGVAETWEDRRICLENVLTLNPDNEVAQHRLAQLNGVSPEDWHNPIGQQNKKPVSAAAAILYPERQQERVEDLFSPDGAWAAQPNPVEFRHYSQYEDVWSSGQPLCAFCAYPVTMEDNRCPHCQKHLFGWRHRYLQTTSRLVNYMVAMCGLTLFLLIDFLLDITLGQPIQLIAVHGLLAVVWVTLILGAYLRHLWGHYGAILLAFFVILINGNLLYTLFQETPFAAMDGDLEVGFLIVVSIALKGLQAMAALVILAWGIFVVSPEFDRQLLRFTAQLDRNPREASEFRALAQRLAQEGMWGSAVLHWQHAAAHAPNHAQYQRELGEAYYRLGHYQRSLDVLQSAYRLAKNPDVKNEIGLLLAEVGQKASLTDQPS